jgi:hypothetical protein
LRFAALVLDEQDAAAFGSGARAASAGVDHLGFALAACGRARERARALEGAQERLDQLGALHRLHQRRAGTARSA